MTKQQYLKRLRRALREVPSHERERLIDYYAELIDEAYDRGKTSREVFQDLDTPEEAAENYLREEGKLGSKQRRRRERRGGSVFLRVLCGFFGVIFGIVSVSVLFSFFVSGLACIIAGFAVLGMSFGLMFGGHAAVAFAQIGAGIGTAGVGILLIACAPLLWKLNAVVWRFAVGKEQREGGSHFSFRSLTTGISLLIVGGIVFVAAFGSLGFSSKALALTENIEEKMVYIENWQEMDLSADNLGLEVSLWNGESACLIYHQTEEAPRTYTEINGSVSLKTGEGTNSWFAQSWRRGIFFSSVADEYNSASLFLPEEAGSELKIDIDNGSVKLTGIETGVLSIDIDNGAVYVSKVTASDISVETNNGAIALDSVNAESVTAKTSNGAIKVEKCSGGSLNCKTSNGAIVSERNDMAHMELKTNNGAVSGTLLGKKEDYTIDAQTSVGANSLTNREGGEKTLNVRVSVGAIDLKFAEQA